ncbi:MAG: hypothetical protein KKD12_08175, partial [Proteobacteria bacterium]|nr:hypothetical protein [Pseudomonadota bacterium]
MFIIALGLVVSSATAAPAFFDAKSVEVLPPAATVTNEACLACHQNPQFSITLGNGEQYDLYVSPDEFNHSIHGEAGYLCVQCHVDFEPEMGHGLSSDSRSRGRHNKAQGNDEHYRPAHY